MRLLRVLGLLLSTFGLTACLNSTTVVKVKPDGSGTVEQTTLVNMAAARGMANMGGGQEILREAPQVAGQAVQGVVLWIYGPNDFIHGPR